AGEDAGEPPAVVVDGAFDLLVARGRRRRGRLRLRCRGRRRRLVELREGLLLLRRQRSGLFAQERDRGVEATEGVGVFVVRGAPALGERGAERRAAVTGADRRVGAGL